MVQRLFAVFWVVLLAVCGVSGGAFACRMTNDYDTPTNFDLVHLVDAIVVATPQSQKDVGDDDYVVNFSIDKVMKGDIGPVYISKKGRDWVRASLGDGDLPVSDPDDLQYTYPGSAASCIRGSFVKGRPVVLFLSKASDGDYYRNTYAFARVAEDYYGEDSLWVTTIRYYMEVQKEPDRLKQMDILRKKYQELAGKADLSDHEAEMAVDIRDYLNDVSEYKPTEYLMEEYQALEDGRPNRFAIADQADTLEAYLKRKKEKRAAKRKAEREAAGLPEEEDDPFGWSEEQAVVYPVDDAKVRVLNDLMEGDRSAEAFFDSLAKREGASGTVLGKLIEYYGNKGKYHEALDMARQNAFRIINTDRDEAVWDFIDGLGSLHSSIKKYEDEDEDTELEIIEEPEWDVYNPAKWQADEQIRTWWPEFALTLKESVLYRYPLGTSWIGSNVISRRSFLDEALVLKTKDFRAKPYVTLTLAQWGDKDAVEWAKTEIDEYIKKYPETDESLYDDNAEESVLDLPILVLLNQYKFSDSEAFELIEKYFCANSKVRIKIINQLGLAVGEDQYNLLLSISKYQNLRDYEKEDLLRVISIYVAEGKKVELKNLGRWDMDLYPLMKGLLQGNIKLDLSRQDPVSCEVVP